MPLDWLNTPLDADLGELVAAEEARPGHRDPTAQVQRRGVLPAHVRLQLADLLIQAGRGEEAVPVQRALRRVRAGRLRGQGDRDPQEGRAGRPGPGGVEARLPTTGSAAAARTALAARPRRGVPELGIEDIDPAAAPRRAAATPGRSRRARPRPSRAQPAGRAGGGGGDLAPEAALTAGPAPPPRSRPRRSRSRTRRGKRPPKWSRSTRRPPSWPASPSSSPRRRVAVPTPEAALRRFLSTLPGSEPSASPTVPGRERALSGGLRRASSRLPPRCSTRSTRRRRYRHAGGPGPAEAAGSVPLRRRARP